MSKDNKTVDRIQAVWNLLGGEKGVDDLINGVTHVVRKVVSYITATFTITVDETLSVEEVVKLGNFNWSNRNIVSNNFPKLKNGQKLDKEVFLFHFNKIMFPAEVITEMSRVGYKPATIWDSIFLAIKKPDIIKQFPIIALNSVRELGGRRRVPFLCVDNGGLSLDLGYFDNGWVENYRFLAVRK
jgi:hypothetical protein